MNFENLQRELFERKLKIWEYFQKSFEILKIFVRKNKMLTILLVIANTFILFFNVLQQNIGLKIKIENLAGDVETAVNGIFLSFLISFMILIISAVLGLVGAIVYSKVVYEIEGKENEYKFKNVAFKYLKFIGIYLLFVLFIGVLVILLIFVAVVFSLLAKNTGINFFYYLALGIPITIYVIIIFLIAINLLYFVQIFYARDMKIVDAIKYNLKLSKNNRLRILIPQLILVLINYIFIIPFFIKMFIFLPLYAVFFISLICGMISVIFNLLIIIISIVIFLNVEYDYLKKQIKEMEKIKENI